MAGIRTTRAFSIGLRMMTASAAVCLVIQLARAQQAAPQVLEYKGTVAAAIEVEVAPLVYGHLVTINFTPGQLVSKGDLLFEFATASRELKLVIAQARVKQTRAEARLAEVKLRNAQTLRARNVNSRIELLEAQEKRDIAVAIADEARANMQLAEAELRDLKLYAQIPGIISRPLVREGAYFTQEAREQTRLAMIAQLDPIHVIGQVPADMYFERGEIIKTLEEVAEQREFGLVLPTGDKYPHTGRPVGRAYAFNPATQTTEVTLEFPNPDYLLRPGLTVTIQSSVRAN
jgi:RND family efflux transporter MFP subunit